jgi:hypothetical protein
VRKLDACPFCGGQIRADHIIRDTYRHMFHPREVLLVAAALGLGMVAVGMADLISAAAGHR